MIKKMNSRERILAATNIQEVDRIPICAPFQGYWSLDNNKVSLMDSINNPKLAVKAQINTLKKCGFDGLDVLWDWLTPVEAVGCGVKIPRTGSPRTVSSVIKDEKVFKTLKIPEPVNDYRINSAKQSAELLIENLSNEKYLFVDLVAPLTLAAELRGIEHLMRDIYKNPSFAKEILQFAVEIIKKYFAYLEPLKVDAFCVSDPTSSAELISKKHFLAFAKPYLKDIAKTVKESGKHLIIHICGDVSDRLADIVDIEPDIISLEHQVDLTSAKKVLKNKVPVLGNLDVATTLFVGTPQDIEGEIKNCVGATGGVGHILSGGCDLAPGTPEENITIWKHVIEDIRKPTQSDF